MGFPKNRFAAGLVALAVILGSALHLACNDGGPAAPDYSGDTSMASSGASYGSGSSVTVPVGQSSQKSVTATVGDEFLCTTLTGYKVWVDIDYLDATLNYEISGLPPNIVNGHEEGYIFQVWWAGHAGGNADPGTYDPTNAEMNDNHRVYGIGAGPDINGSQSFTYPASFAGKKLKVVIYLQPKRERLSDDPNGQCDRGRYVTPELRPTPSCAGPRCNPVPECKEGEVRDPQTGQCAPVCNLQQPDFLRGLGVTEDVPCVCPEGYTKDPETGVCNPPPDECKPDSEPDGNECRWDSELCQWFCTPGPDPTCETNPELCPPPVDVCPNLEGNQSEVPEGYELVNGQCVLIPPPPVDVCPNIQGNQSEVPEGYELVNGQCVLIPEPEPDYCFYEVTGQNKAGKCTSRGGDWENWDNETHHNHCRLEFPGVSNNSFNLAPGQSADGCLRKQDN